MNTVPTIPTSSEATETYLIELPGGRVVHSPAPAEQFDGYVGIIVGDPDDRNMRADVTLAEGETVWHCWYPDHIDEVITKEQEIEVAQVCRRAAMLTLELNGATITGGAA